MARGYMTELTESRSQRDRSHEEGENAGVRDPAHCVVMTYGYLALGLAIFTGLGFVLGVLVSSYFH